MKILFVNTYKDWGGDEKWTILIGKGLKAKNHRVVIGSRPGLETEKRALENGLEIYPINIGPDIAFWKVPGIMKYIKQQRFDVVVCVQNRDVKIAGLAAKLAGTKLVLGRQALDAMKRRLYHRIAYTKFVDGVITNTFALKKLYMSYGWFKDDFIHPVHDGMDIQRNVTDINLKEEFGLPEDAKVIVGAGRIVYQKGFDLLIKVAKMAKENNLNWRFIIMGDGQLKSNLEEMAKKLNVEDYIQFIGFRKDVLPIMKAADLFVLSSRSESMTHVLREAMSVNTACVATDVFGISELIEHEKSGYIVQSESVEDIFKGIETVLGDAELKAKIEVNSLKRIEDAFTIQRMVDDIEQLFNRLLKAKSA